VDQILLRKQFYLNIPVDKKVTRCILISGGKKGNKMKIFV